MRLAVATIVIGIVMAIAGSADATGEGVHEMPAAAQRFFTRVETPLVGFTALRHLEAASRNGSMRGWMDVCTELVHGEFRYRIVGEGGSAQIRRRVLVAALDAEAKARRNGDTARAALDPANYIFLDEREEPGGLRRVGMIPLRKDVMLVAGAMIVEAEGDLVRVEGALARPPSFWTRHVEVVRRYARVGGVRVPVAMESTASVLIFGRSSFAMTYDYRTINGVALMPDAGRGVDRREENGVTGTSAGDCR